MAATIIGGLAVLAMIPLPAPGTSLLPICGLRSLFGLPCPLCGGTRAAQAVLQGDFAHAAYLNPLAFPAVGLLLVAALICACELVRRRPLANWDHLRHRLSSPVACTFRAVLLLVWWPIHLLAALRTPKPELVDFHNPVAKLAQHKALQLGSAR